MNGRHSVAYLAGVFDGEGWVSAHDSHGVEVCVQSTDHDMLTPFVEAYGGCIYSMKQRPGCKPSWTWKIAARTDVWRFLDDIKPFLTERRQKKITSLSDRRVSPSVTRREEILVGVADLTLDGEIEMSQRELGRRLGYTQTTISRNLLGTVGRPSFQVAP